MKSNPPRLAQRFFSWYCRNHLHDSILGDLDEQYDQNRLKYGRIRSGWIYWLNVIRFLNRFTLRKGNKGIPKSTFGLFKNNIVSSLRFLQRNRSFAFINQLGLTIGLTGFMIILLFVKHQLSFDRFHPNSEQIYRINCFFKDQSGNETALVNSPPALARGISGKFPELEKATRLRYAMNCLLTHKTYSFYENTGYYADSLFLEILRFDLAAGDPTRALDLPNSIVITEALAVKYFGHTSPLGETLVLNDSIPLKVTGILVDLPSNSHLNFNFLISFPTYTVPEGYASDLTSWSWLGFLTYVELKSNTDPARFEQKLIQHFEELNPENPTPIQPRVQQLTDLYLGSSGMTDDTASGIRTGDSFSLKALMIVAGLIVLIAGFNFSNLTSALSMNRSKSIAVRKVLGINRTGIVIQLLTESLMLVLCCAILSLIIVALFFSTVSAYMGWELRLSTTDAARLIPVVLIIGVFIGIASGLYPAFTQARFGVIPSLKGTLKLSARNPWQTSNVIVILQFAISIALVSTTMVMTRQIEFLRSTETGYTKENIVLIKMLPAEMARYFEVYKDRLLKNSSVISASRTDRTMGEPWPWSIIQRTNENPDQAKRVFFNLGDYDYFKTLGIPIQSGRAFSWERATDEHAIILNQKAVDYLKLENPLGKQVYFFGMERPRTIIGVVENFHYTTLHQEIGPAVIVLPFIDLEHMYVRFAPGISSSQIALLEETWRHIAPGKPLQWKFLDDDLHRRYQSEEKLSNMIQAFSFLAIVLACMGLYGIVMFFISNRLKEVGIRKVLGASIRSLYALFVRKYIVLVSLAMLLVLPVIHPVLNTWLTGFAYHVQIDWWIYALASLLLIFPVLLTTSTQILRAIRSNPTSLLKDE